jgi:hypothetical protein
VRRLPIYPNRGDPNAEGDPLVPWERHAVEKILPLFQEAAANTESAIDHFNENHLWIDGNRERAGRVSHDSEQIAEILKNCLKYDKLREREIQIEGHIWANSGE